MAPQHTEVLFMHADRVLDDSRLPVGVRDSSVEVEDLPEAVTAPRQRCRRNPDAVLARIERVFEEVGRAWIAIRNDHLRQRTSVEDRAIGLVGVAMLVAKPVK